MNTNWPLKFLYAFVKTAGGAAILHWVVRYASWLLPVKRLADTRTLLALPHPAPSYPYHVLFLPKKHYRSLLDLPPDDPVFLHDMLAVAQSLIKEHHLEEKGYRLMINGGPFQDVPLLHIHLIGGNHD